MNKNGHLITIPQEESQLINTCVDSIANNAEDDCEMYRA